MLVIDEGDMSYRDMIADVQDGLIVEQLLGAGQSNILGGEFKANVLLGYRVKGGEIVGRVKNTLISGNVYSTFNKIRSMEKKAHWIGGALKVPAICCDGINVATSE